VAGDHQPGFSEFSISYAVRIINVNVLIANMPMQQS
jgi:hypothetical protein